MRHGHRQPISPGCSDDRRSAPSDVQGPVAIRCRRLAAGDRPRGRRDRCAHGPRGAGGTARPRPCRGAWAPGGAGPRLAADTGRPIRSLPGHSTATRCSPRAGFPNPTAAMGLSEADSRRMATAFGTWRPERSAAPLGVGATPTSSRAAPCRRTAEPSRKPAPWWKWRRAVGAAYSPTISTRSLGWRSHRMAGRWRRRDTMARCACGTCSPARRLGCFGKAVDSLKARWVIAVAFSPDGRTLASGGLDKQAHIWDVSTLTGRQREVAERSAAESKRTGRISPGTRRPGTPRWAGWCPSPPARPRSWASNFKVSSPWIAGKVIAVAGPHQESVTDN